MEEALTRGLEILTYGFVAYGALMLIGFAVFMWKGPRIIRWMLDRFMEDGE